MIKLYSHENGMLIHNLKNLLEHQHIECVIKNDIVSSGIGEVPPIEVWPELWIKHTSDKARAESLIKEAIEGDPKKVSWFCEQCGESNAPAFEICWKCGQPGPE